MKHNVQRPKNCIEAWRLFTRLLPLRRSRVLCQSIPESNGTYPGCQRFFLHGFRCRHVSAVLPSAEREKKPLVPRVNGNVSRVRFPDPASYVGWVCWFSTLLREVFLRELRFSPLLKNQHLIWFIWSDLIWFIWFDLFDLIYLIWFIWFDLFDLIYLIWFIWFDLIYLIWFIWFDLFDLIYLIWFIWFTVSPISRALVLS